MDDQRHDLLALLMPLSRELRRIEDAAAAQQGLTMWQYAILSVAHRHPGRNQAEVADALCYSRNRIVSDLDQLEDAGLLTRRPGTDRRSNVLTVTATGRGVMSAVQQEIHRHEDELLASLPASTRRILVATLHELSEQVRSCQ